MTAFLYDFFASLVVHVVLVVLTLGIGVGLGWRLREARYRNDEQRFVRNLRRTEPGDKIRCGPGDAAEVDAWHLKPVDRPVDVSVIRGTPIPLRDNKPSPKPNPRPVIFEDSVFQESVGGGERVVGCVYCRLHVAHPDWSGCPRATID